MTATKPTECTCFGFALRKSHIRTLIRSWERAHGITPNGFASAETVASIEAAQKTEHAERHLMRYATDVALGERGNGESGSNNRGSDVYLYRQHDGTGMPWDLAGPWCASFASFCLMQAAKRLEFDLPFRTSRGAKTLTERVAEAGRECVNPEPFALICWHRSSLGSASRKGHVGFIVSYDRSTDTVITVDGNKNRRGQRLATVETFDHPNGRWRDGLYMIATIAPRA